MNIIIVLALFFGSFFSAHAQKDPVSWSFSIEKVGEDSYIWKAKATISSKWNIYAMDTPDEGPVPTSFDFESNPSISWTSAVEVVTPAKQKFDPLFELEVKYHTKEAIFQRKFTSKTTNPRPQGMVSYMSCDDEKCLPPKDIKYAY